jgi:DNA-directed RNA polymerase specialized sigma24 family protein
MEWIDPSSDNYKSVCRYISKIMPARLNPVFDAEDFVMDAIMEILEKHIDHSPTPGLLTTIARRNMQDAAKSPRNRQRTLEIDMADWRSDIAQSDLGMDLEGLEIDPILKKILRLMAEGYELPQVAETIGVGLRTVQRMFANFREEREKTRKNLSPLD